ncbi:chromate transporter [Solibacillus sp. FSL R5-0449]|uniref:chromate transporter n=1 Tax=Solibacillus sp. FSL R5-0449 TaxID=2921639 RepID=UPI0030CA8779
MIFWEIFIAFLIPNLLAYGGGPASIPLIEHEVVDRYAWMTQSEFSEFLALANSLPGPIATKMAGYIGFEVGGILGSIIALFATVAPTLILMITLLNLLHKYRDSPKVIRLSSFVLPAIAVLLITLTFDFAKSSYESNKLIPTILMIVGSYLALEKFKVPSIIVIVVGLLIGGFLL